MRLTRNEVYLLVGLMATLVIGSIVKHYRAQVRLAAAEQATPAPAPKK